MEQTNQQNYVHKTVGDRAACSNIEERPCFGIDKTGQRQVPNLKNEETAIPKSTKDVFNPAFKERGMELKRMNQNAREHRSNTAVTCRTRLDKNSTRRVSAPFNCPKESGFGAVRSRGGICIQHHVKPSHIKVSGHKKHILSKSFAGESTTSEEGPSQDHTCRLDPKVKKALSEDAALPHMRAMNRSSAVNRNPYLNRLMSEDIISAETTTTLFPTQLPHRGRSSSPADFKVPIPPLSRLSNSEKDGGHGKSEK